MVIFRENTEDIYAGIEWEAGSAQARKVLAFLETRVPQGVQEDPLPRLRAASASSRSRARGPSGWCAPPSSTPSRNRRKSVTLVHKGNIMKFTEGAFRDWGYALAEREFADRVYTWEQWERTKAARGEEAANAEQKAALGAGQLLVKDAIADITLQQVLTRPDEFDVIATLNLNGDYLSDALAAQVGGIGIAPGGNINYVTGHAIFEATHGTAPKYANLDKVNPGSVILSGEMMLRHLGWNEAADLIVKGMDGAIAGHRVTYDFARLMKAEGVADAVEVKCSEFGAEIVEAHVVNVAAHAQARERQRMASRKKIALIGAGQIGGTLALLAGQRSLGDVVLVDLVRGRGQGQGARPAGDPRRVRLRRRPDRRRHHRLRGHRRAPTSCIVTAGVPRKPGMSREDLLKVNLEAITKVAQAIKQHAPDAFVIVVTNPLDSMVYAMHKITGFPKNRVVGMAGVLDTARFQYFVGAAAGVSPQDVKALVLGGHGDDMVPLLRYSLRQRRAADQAARRRPSSTPSSSGPARAAARSSRCSGPARPSTPRPPPPSPWPRPTSSDQKRVLTCSALLEGEYGVKGLFVGVPVVIGAGGVERVLEVELDEAERAMFEKSVASVRKSVAETGL